MGRLPQSSAFHAFSTKNVLNLTGNACHCPLCAPTGPVEFEPRATGRVPDPPDDLHGESILRIHLQAWQPHDAHAGASKAADGRLRGIEVVAEDFALRLQVDEAQDELQLQVAGTGREPCGRQGLGDAGHGQGVGHGSAEGVDRSRSSPGRALTSKFCLFLAVLRGFFIVLHQVFLMFRSLFNDSGAISQGRRPFRACSRVSDCEALPKTARKRRETSPGGPESPESRSKRTVFLAGEPHQGPQPHDCAPGKHLRVGASK